MGRRELIATKGRGIIIKDTHTLTHTHTRTGVSPIPTCPPTCKKRDGQHKICVQLTGNPAREKSQKHAEKRRYLGERRRK